LKWIKKFFGKKYSSEETDFREIDFEDLPAWLDDSYQKISFRIKTDASNLLRKLEALLSELKESNSMLAEAKVKGDFDVRAVKLAKSSRENVTKQIATLIYKINLADDTDFRSLKEFYETAVKNFDICLEYTNRSFNYTKGVFPQESKEVNESLFSLGKVFKDLRELIFENVTETEAIEVAYLDIKEIQKLSTLIVAEKLELESKKGRIQALKHEIGIASQAVEELRNGDAWHRLYNLQKESATIRERLKKAEEDLSFFVLSLSSHLSKIKKLHESGRYNLKPEVKQQLYICLEDPINVAPSFFPELLKVFEDQSLEMQTQKKNKALIQVKTAILDFSERNNDYLKVLQEFEAKKTEIAVLDTGKLVALEHKEEELQNRARLLEEDIENSEKRLTYLIDELENKRKKLFGSINSIDSYVKLHF
jgi:hypothetical protein